MLSCLCFCITRLMSNRQQEGPMSKTPIHIYTRSNCSTQRNHCSQRTHRAESISLARGDTRYWCHLHPMYRPRGHTPTSIRPPRSNHRHLRSLPFAAVALAASATVQVEGSTMLRVHETQCEWRGSSTAALLASTLLPRRPYTWKRRGHGAADPTQKNSMTCHSDASSKIEATTPADAQTRVTRMYHEQHRLHSSSCM